MIMAVFFNAERFKVLRREKGLSQEQLAVAAGVSCSTVTAIETGRNINPSVSTLLKLAPCLDVALAGFFIFKVAANLSGSRGFVFASSDLRLSSRVLQVFDCEACVAG